MTVHTMNQQDWSGEQPVWKCVLSELVLCVTKFGRLWPNPSAMHCFCCVIQGWVFKLEMNIMLLKCIHIFRENSHWAKKDEVFLGVWTFFAHGNNYPNNPYSLSKVETSDLKDKNPVFLKIFQQIKSHLWCFCFRGAGSPGWVW